MIGKLIIGILLGRAQALLEKDKDKAIALLESGFSKSKIASMFDVSRSTILRAEKEYNKLKEKSGPIDSDKMLVTSNSDNEKLLAKMDSIAQIKEHFADKCTNTMERIVNSISDIDLEKAGLRDKAISFAVFTDKMALFNGIASTQVDVRHSLVESVRKCQSPVEIIVE